MKRSDALRSEAAEVPLQFSCGKANLIGILHQPRQPAETGVLVITGGPQYRAGSHRQFVLLARHLAEAGVAVMRFDYRGMGDSGGEPPGFDAVDEDIRAALDCFQEQCPGVRRIALWGLCDAASAAMMYAMNDKRICGLAVLNPWARTEVGEARALLRHYYIRRVFSVDFWRKLVSGGFRPGAALKSLLANLSRAVDGSDNGRPQRDNGSYIDRMREGLAGFDGPVLLVISGDDLTAAEFLDMVTASTAWKRLLKRRNVTRRDLPAADHTFSTAAWRAQVEKWTADWVTSIRG
jgi:exosortase A-associated hydrolase 1